MQEIFRGASCLFGSRGLRRKIFLRSPKKQRWVKNKLWKFDIFGKNLGEGSGALTACPPTLLHLGRQALAPPLCPHLNIVWINVICPFVLTAYPFWYVTLIFGGSPHGRHKCKYMIKPKMTYFIWFDNKSTCKFDMFHSERTCWWFLRRGTATGFSVSPDKTM